MARLLHFPRNTQGRDFVVGDIHGCYSKLNIELERIGFTIKDRLFSVGDLVDRGPESALCLDWLSLAWFHPVQGNHDTMAHMWQTGQLDSWLYEANGGAWNITSMPDERTVFGDALDALPWAIEVETEQGLVGIVHADCPYNTWDELRNQLADETEDQSHVLEALTWSRDRIRRGDVSTIPDLRALIVGHTFVPKLKVLGNVHYIDTGAVFKDGNGFTILDLATLEQV